MQKIFILVLTMLAGELAFAQGVGGGASDYKNGKNTKGLCTTDNKEESYFQEGDCQTLKEALTQDKCTAPLLEKLRKKMLQAQTNPQPATKPSDTFGTGNDLVCSSRQDTVSITDPKFLKNPQTFGTVVMQFFMSVAIAESNLDVFNNLQKSAGRMINAGATGGLMNLNLQQMDDPKYNQNGCGCHVTNSSQQTAWFWSLFVGEQAFADSFLAGPSPGPRDAHHSLQCGVYMALFEAANDGVLFGGTKGKKGDEGPKGAAKIFKTLQEFESAPRAQAANPQDPFQYINNPDLRFVLTKVKTYCERNLKEDGSLTHTFAEDFNNGGALRAPY